MIFSFTDLVISGTLLLNALTLVSSKSSESIEHLDSELELGMNSNRDSSGMKHHEVLPLMSPSASSTTSSESGEVGTSSAAASPNAQGLTHLVRLYYSIFGRNSAIMLQIRRVMVSIRLYSCIIAVWNILFMMLMVFVFRN
jgi:hypothetical protein